MEPPPLTPKPTFFFFLLLSLCPTTLSKSLQTQTFHPQPLFLRQARTPADLSWSDFSDSQLPTQSISDFARQTTFSLPLQHIDSLSHAHSQSTPESIFSTRLHRDALRVKTLNALLYKRWSPSSSTSNFNSSTISGLPLGSAEYFTRLGVGTPPKHIYMILDTGSDLIWLQCKPCRKCYNQSDPIFEPAKSTSYSKIPCESPLCDKLRYPGCRKRSCLYYEHYGDGTVTIGDFATETLTFCGTRIPHVGFGCGHNNQGLLAGSAGLLGLGRGALSFLSQTGWRFGSKFSYCFVNRDSTKPSSIIFGDSSVPKSTVFTRMISNPDLDTLYYLELTGISVGDTRVPGISSSLFKIENGGLIIDSGTAVTRLKEPVYVALRDAFRNATTRLKRASGFSIFDTCYDLSGKNDVKVPTIVMHFGGGADVSLPPTNYLIPVNGDQVFCFAFAKTSGVSIIGNIQQQGFRIVYDIVGSKIGFAPRGC